MLTHQYMHVVGHEDYEDCDIDLRDSIQKLETGGLCHLPTIILHITRWRIDLTRVENHSIFVDKHSVAWRSLGRALLGWRLILNVLPVLSYVVCVLLLLGLSLPYHDSSLHVIKISASNIIVYPVALLLVLLRIRLILACHYFAYKISVKFSIRALAFSAKHLCVMGFAQSYKIKAVANASE